MAASDTPRVGVLGGPGTFASQAAHGLLELRPRLGGITYMPSGPHLWRALEDGGIQKAVITAETTRTGFGGLAGRLVPPVAPFFVNAEIAVPYDCSLLVRPGTTMQDIRRVLGHGSLEQCRPFLAHHLPDAEVVIHQENSLAAAREVAHGDGHLAVVGTAAAGRETGLVELAAGIDEGSLGNFWLVATEPDFSATPDRLVVAGRFPDDGSLTALIASLAAAGFHVRSTYAQASGAALFEYDHLLVFSRAGSLGSVQQALARVKGARLLGAFDAC